MLLPTRPRASEINAPGALPAQPTTETEETATVRVPSEIDLFYLALDQHGNVQLRDGALEFHSDYWSARVPVQTSEDDEDGLVNGLALLAAQRTGWNVRCARQELTLGDWARFWRTEYDPGAGFVELLGPTSRKTTHPIEVGVNTRMLHRLVTALGSNGHIALTVTGRKSIRLRPLPLTDEPAWEAFVEPYKLP